MDTLAEKIRSAAVERGISFRTLAKRVDVSPSTISRWANNTNEPPVGKMSLIAVHTDKPLAYFLPDIAGPDQRSRLEQAVLDLAHVLTLPEACRELAAAIIRRDDASEDSEVGAG